MKLREVFDTKANINWRYKDNDVWEGFFKFNGDNYMVQFMQDYDMPNGDKRIPIWSLQFMNSSATDPYGITKSGKSSQVFGIIINAIRDFIKQQKPKGMTFIAKEPSRVKLYTRMLEKLSAPLGYKKLDDKLNPFKHQVSNDPTFIILHKSVKLQ